MSYVVIGSELFVLFFLTGLSTFTDKKRMPPHLTMKPERLWQLDPESRFPDELEIFVPQDRDFKGYIRIKKGTQVDKDKLIEVKSLFSIKTFVILAGT